ncbi:hypothetical protein KY290_014865 [Solanum tuberosum]|uniref:Uncharacterized protein n=1 Tax=Solanum tuberosum TaxID=4113 RepID=A0ABQ7VQX0_SOLTU|nr:hypothetical protein KY290_014865 [Solanum tuberosum]
MGGVLNNYSWQINRGCLSFRESLELDDGSNVMHERRKPFMRSCSLYRRLIHDGSSFANIEFENVLNQRGLLESRKYILRTSPGAKLRASHCGGQNFPGKDILDEDDHLMDLDKQTENYEKIWPVLGDLNRGMFIIYYDKYDFTQKYYHGEENLKNYLIPRVMLSFRGWMGTRIYGIDAGNRGKTDDLIRQKKSRRIHSAPPFYQGKKKFFAKSESRGRQQDNIKTVHDVPLMPCNLSLEIRAVRRLHHSAEAICLELP